MVFYGIARGIFGREPLPAWANGAVLGAMILAPLSHEERGWGEVSPSHPMKFFITIITATATATTTRPVSHMRLFAMRLFAVRLFLLVVRLDDRLLNVGGHFLVAG